MHFHCRKFYTHCFPWLCPWYPPVTGKEQHNEGSLTWQSGHIYKETDIHPNCFLWVNEKLHNYHVYFDLHWYSPATGNYTLCCTCCKLIPFAILLLTALPLGLAASPAPATEMEENANTSLEEDFEGQATHTGKEPNWVVLFCLFPPKIS